MQLQLQFTRLPYRLGWSIWLNGKDWSIDYVPNGLELDASHIRIGDLICVAKRLIPFVNVYYIRIVGIM